MVAFHNVLPDQGLYCAAYGSEKPDRGTSFYKTKDELIAAMMEGYKSGQVWVSYAAFKKDARRSADNVAALKSFVFDIDVGPDGYATKEEAWWAFNTDLLEKTKLPEPTFIVDSGHGYHVWWVLHSEIAPDRWHRAALRLKALLKSADPKLAKDTSRVADTAGLLRWPGTINRKNGGAETVAIVHKGELIDIDEFEALLPAINLPARTNGSMFAGPVPQHILDRRKLRHSTAWEEEPEDVDYLRSALLTLKSQADNYPTWIAVAQSLFNAAHEGRLNEQDAFDLFDEFSQLSAKYNNADHCYSFWEKLSYRSGGARIGLGSIYHQADAQGWTKPTAPPPQVQQYAPHDGDVDDETQVTTIDNETGEKVRLTPFIAYPDASSTGVPTKDSGRNVRAFFEALSLKFWYNEFDNEVYVDNFPPHSLVDDICETQLLMRANDSGLKMGIEFLRHCIGDVAFHDRRHPIRDYLKGLVWDRKKRIPTWMTDYLGAPQNEYTKYVGSAFLCAAVRRIMTPGCKFDMLLILEGPQGNKKSSSIAALAGEQYFSDNVELGIDTKQLMELTQGNWILEVQELGNRNKRDVGIIKAQLSKRTDAARMAYKHKTSKFKRQFVMVGTTNEGEATGGYLADPTGNRRFWPIKTGKINVAALKRDRDQIWAEAVWRESTLPAEEMITLPERLWPLATAEQEKRRIKEPLEDVICEAIDGVKDGFVARDTLYTAMGLGAGADRSGVRSRAQRHKGLIERVMKSAGWAPNRKVSGNLRVRGYVIGNGKNTLVLENNHLVIMKVKLNGTSP